MCNNCDKITPCGCDEIVFQECPKKLDLLCTYYKGDTLEPLGIVAGMTGTEVLVALNDYIRDILLNLEVSPTVIKNVGGGVEVYKGLSPNLIDEFRTFAGVGIDIESTEDLVTFSINEEWLELYITQIINETTGLTLDFRFSQLESGQGTPESNPTGWDTTTSVDDVWMAIKETIGGVSGVWKVIKTKGNPGPVGPPGPQGPPGGTGASANTTLTANIFKKSETQPTTPTGGTFANFVPAGWFDGIPPSSSATGPVWMSTRIFSSDGNAPQQAAWTTPEKVVDTATVNYEWSSVDPNPGTPTSDPANWHDPGTESDVWMAIQRIENDKYLPWVVMRIKGESGGPGPAGPPGASGTGFTVTNSNPLQSIAVGADGILQVSRTYNVTFSVYANTTQLVASSNAVLLAGEYRVELPASPLPGITVTKLTNNTLTYTVAIGTTFPETSITSAVEIKVGPTNQALTSSFVIAPVRGAEDALSLSLNTTSTVVKVDAFGTVITPVLIDLQAVQQNYSEPVTWVTVPAGVISGTGLAKQINTATIFGSGDSLKVTISTPNGLTDEVTIVKVQNGPPGIDGNPGAPGINGTTGPSPRLLEFVNGGVYENGGQYIDYAYYRTTDTLTEGWYTVKLPVGHTPGTVVTKTYTSGVPNTATDFNKAPFTKEMSFGTVVAEQANLAGFLFRNGVLNSQTGSLMAACHPQPGVEKKNLTLDGIQGIVSFLDRLVMDKTGIVLKDDCGVRRMAFQWGLSGVPILKFFAEDGITVTWEAGNNGYQTYITTVPESYAPLYAFYKATTPDGSFLEGKAVFTSSNMCGVNDIYSPSGKAYYYRQPNTPEEIKGYYYDKGVQPSYLPAQESGSGKYFTTADYNGTLVPDGWYLSSFSTFVEGGENKTKGMWIKITAGIEGEQLEVVYADDPTLPTCTPTQMSQWQTGY